MPLSTPATNQSFGRTFIVAAAVLGAVAFLQLGAVTWAFFSKPGAALQQTADEGAAKPPSKIDVSNIPVSEPPDETLNAAPDPIVEARPHVTRPQPIRAEPTGTEANPGESVSGVTMTPDSIRPRPVPLDVFAPKQNPHFVELVEQGKLLRNAGDTAGALVKFREAAAIDSANPLPYAESAYTYEKMSLADKAAEQWRIVLGMGEAAGVYYSAAQAKLNVALADATRSVSAAQSNAPIPDGKMLAISTPRMEDLPDASAEKRFTLHVPIRARAGEQVSVRDTKIFVLFFERLRDGSVVRTAADVQNRWESTPVNWSSGEETLNVDYNLPANEGRGEPRTYYGYIVRLYYKGELQDTQAQPPALNQKFPAEYQLSE